MKLEIKCKGASTANINDLLDFQGDLKALSEQNYQLFKSELLELGFSEPISVWVNPEGKKYILNGHQRRRTLINMMSEGIEVPDLPINLVEADDIKQAKRKVLALTSQFGEMSSDSLLDFCEKNDLSFDEMMDDFRFPELEPLNLEAPEGTEETEGDDEVSEEVETVTKLGDFWELGDHRLLCGDSTDKATVERLMDGHKADMVFTDPPYGISIVQNNQVGGGGAFGVGKEAKSKGKVIKANKHKEVIGDDTIDVAVSAIEIIKELKINVQIIWGGNYYANHLENSNCWIVWDKQTGESTFADAELAWTNQETKVRIFQHRWSGMVKASEHGEKRVHPTQKPIALAEWSFQYYGENCDIILDMFLGSGSTLIACEKTGRKCYGMELDPHYCDVIVNRYKEWCEKNDKEFTIKLNGDIWGA